MARSSIYVGEIAHQSPIPNASRIGNIIVSGLIRGADPATAKLAATLEQQCAFMFLHMRQAVEAGQAFDDPRAGGASLVRFHAGCLDDRNPAFGFDPN
jgi:hypothetical protein